MRIEIDKHLTVPMRDGTELSADLYKPAGPEPAPTLVQRLPYDKEFPVNDELMRFVQSGYAVLVQDTRGRFRSGGTFDPFVHEADDGEDTIAWAAAQDWSTGDVGTIGMSYYGATQWLAAGRTPPALKATAPTFTSADYYEGWTYQGGAFQLGFTLLWTLLHLTLADLGARLQRGEDVMAQFGRILPAVDGVDALYRPLPLTDVPVLDGLAPYYRTWLDHPTYDGFWQALAPKERYEQVTAPSLNIGGWHDIFLARPPANFNGMQARGGSAAARRPRLVVGPWAHGIMYGEFAERGYGVLSSGQGGDIAGEQVRWFDHHLRGIDNGVDSAPPVRLFVMGANAWRDFDDWPPPGVRYEAFHLHSGGRANTRHGDGTLTTAAPGEEPEDRYRYDPRDPVPSRGGATFL